MAEGPNSESALMVPLTNMAPSHYALSDNDGEAFLAPRENRDIDNEDAQPTSEGETSFQHGGRSRANFLKRNVENTQSMDGKCGQLFRTILDTLMDWWWLELASAALSVGCLAAIIGVLAAINGKPESEWGFVVSPNTVISIFATVAKTALLYPVAQGLGQLKWIYFRRPRPLIELEDFDLATRGLFGAVQLLCRIIFRAKVAALGSFIILTALTFDPFLQQTIIRSLEDVPVNGSAPALARYASVWNDTPTDPMGHYTVVDSYGNFAPPYGGPFEQALLSGLSNPLRSWPVSCPTSSCMWPPFTSLGICGNCVDISSTTNSSCNVLEETNQTICYYNTPNGLTLVTYNWTDGTNSYGTIFNITNNFTVTSLEMIGPEYYSSVKMAAIKLVRLDGITFSIQYITECQMEFCARTFSNTTLVNGSLFTQTSETMLEFDSTWEDKYNNSYITWKVPANTSNDLSGNSTFSTNIFSYQLGAVLIGGLLNSSLEAVEPDQGSSLITTLTAPIFVGSSDLGKTIEDISWVLSAYISNSSSGVNHTGQALQSEIYIQVRWPWLILPIFLVLASLFFLITVIVVTWSCRTHLWKSSSLALLFHGLQDIPEETQSVDKLSEMMSVAKTLDGEFKTVVG